MQKRKWLSLLLAMTMLFTCVPGGIFAEKEDVEPVTVVEEEPVQNEAPAQEPEAEPAPEPDAKDGE